MLNYGKFGNSSPAISRKYIRTKSGVAILKIQQMLATLLVTVLFGLTLWLAVFSQPARLDPALTAANHGSHAMYHAVQFKVLDSQGQPAPNAIVTVADQQLIADEQGMVQFGMLLHTGYESTVFYKNQHFKQNVLVYGTSLNLTMDSMSLEFRRMGAAACGLALTVLLIFLLAVRKGNIHHRGHRGHSGSQRIFTQLLVGKKHQQEIFAPLPRRARESIPTLNLRNTQSSVLSPQSSKNRQSSIAASPSLGVNRQSLFTMVVLAVTAGAVLPLLFSPVVARAAGAPIVDSLPIPEKIQIEQDDNNAIVTWNGKLLTYYESEPGGVAGYRVSWGAAGQPLDNVTFTDYRIAQLQPLVNGQPYEMQIQSVDKLGNLSKPSPVVRFTGDPTRVNEMRVKMNGFFDDFNLPAGGTDERKWNSAYSWCNDPALSAFFVNNQYHSHNLINDSNCDRGQNISRVRQMFDFTNRTGTITFDFDGSFRRDFWYLDIVPELVDITGQITLDDETSVAAPVNMLRIRQNEQNLAVIWVDAKGHSHVLAETDEKNPPLEDLGVGLVSNVRRHWAIKLSQTKVEILVNGKSALSSKIQLPFSKAHLLWNQFSYNTQKSNQPYNLIHWDNFGFDAPADFKPTTVTHNYRTSKPGGGDFADVYTDKPASMIINVPDAVKGAKEERLLFTLQASDANYEWSQQDRVIVNGTSIAIPQPKSGNLKLEDLVNVLTPYTTVLKLPAGLIRQGENKLEFQMTNSGVLNVHFELDFDAGNAPKFTPSYQIYSERAAIPAMPDVGPGALITEVGKHDDTLYDTDRVFEVSGVVDVKVTVTNEVALRATGKNPGLNRIELLLGQTVIYKEEFNPAPNYAGVIKFDTTKYTNGVHQLFLRAYNVYNTPSLSDFFELGSLSGDYQPINVKIQNANPGTLAVVPFPPTPTPTEQPDNQPTQPAESPTQVAGNGNPVATPVPGNASSENPANNGAVVTNPTVVNSPNWTWAYALGGALAVLWLGIGSSTWLGVRRGLRVANPAAPPLPVISLDYMLFWPFLRSKKKRKQKPVDGSQQTVGGEEGVEGKRQTVDGEIQG